MTSTRNCHQASLVVSTNQLLAELELDLQCELSSLLSVHLGRSETRTVLDLQMVQTIRKVFEQYSPTIHITDL